MKKVLITGAGTGFGHEAAMRLAEKEFDVIATVEISAQVQTRAMQSLHLDLVSEGQDQRFDFAAEQK